MIPELDLYGIYLSPLLGCAILALLVAAGLRRLLRRLDAYRFVWHEALFDVALYVIVLGCLWTLATRATA